MKVVFADTFYWIALTLPGDAANARAEQIKDEIVTTEEVLSEYLAFFCASPEYLRSQVASNVERYCMTLLYASFHRATIHSSAGSNSTGPALTKDTA